MKSIKDIFLGSLGTIGLILYYLLGFVMLIFPIWIINPSSYLVWIGLTMLLTFVPQLTLIFWVWGLIVAISGVQSWITVAYYICFVLLYLPKLIHLVLSIYFERNHDKY